MLVLEIIYFHNVYSTLSIFNKIHQNITIVYLLRVFGCGLYSFAAIILQKIWKYIDFHGDVTMRLIIMSMVVA